MSVCLDGVGDPIYVVRVSDVPTNTVGRGTNYVECLIEALFVAAGDEDMRAFGRQPLGGGKTDSTFRW